MENGRCAWHGGKTGRKDQWHRLRWPSKSSSNAIEKLNRKLRDRERQARKKAKCLAAMTPEERRRYEEWHKARKPGPPGPRAAERTRRKQNKDMQNLFAAPERRPAATAEG
jgi:hypothetical protein